jgi:sec-independent protein translocase protein TatA
MNFIFSYIPSGYEIVIILVVVLILFGGKKIPELMRGLGSGLKEFKKATNEVDDVKKEIDNTASETNKDQSQNKNNNDPDEGGKETKK